MAVRAKISELKSEMSWEEFEKAFDKPTASVDMLNIFKAAGNC